LYCARKLHFWGVYLWGKLTETFGILCEAGSQPDIAGNALLNNGAGVMCKGSSSPLIRSNIIQYNGEGVASMTNSQPDLGSVGNNHLQYNTGYHVSNLTYGITIDATDNWWGKASGPKPTKIIGSVQWYPPLTQDPNLPMPTSSHGGGETTPELPERFALAAAYPNPFNPTVTIRYAVPDGGGHVRIEVYDVAGRIVRVLRNERSEPGYHDVVWHGDVRGGGTAATGIYFVRMMADGVIDTKKIVLVK